MVRPLICTCGRAAILLDERSKVQDTDLPLNKPLCIICKKPIRDCKCQQLSEVQLF